MRKTIALLLALICLLTLAGCGPRSMNDIIQNEPSIRGLVKDIGDRAILIENEDGEYWVSLDAENKDSMTHFSIGDQVVVYFGGNIAESSPMQISTVYAICLLQPADRTGEATRQLLQLEEPPTCILFPDDYSYIGGLNVITELGLKVPEDISAVGYDGIHLAKVLHLTTYNQNAIQIGTAAAAQLISLIERPKTTLIDRVMIRGHLQEGTSVKYLTD